VCKKEKCRRCGRVAHLTKHHYLPKHVFGDSDKTTMICRDCHNKCELEVKELERRLLQKYAGAYYNLAKCTGCI
jgi:hypothetical protein